MQRELKQCPYSKACKCEMIESCDDCETKSEWFILQDAISGYTNETAE